MKQHLEMREEGKDLSFSFLLDCDPGVGGRVGKAFKQIASTFRLNTKTSGLGSGLLDPVQVRVVKQVFDARERSVPLRS